ncbi:MAG: PAS domain S-box protein [Caldilineaceae bacterium]
MLITFAETSPPQLSGEETAVERIHYSQDEYTAQLEQELKSTREYLQTVIEELESTNEELKSSNEELQSANEELQSTNEELQTSKEELQSVNEELVTLNNELQIRLEELTAANDDIKNLMDSALVGIIFLDTDLRIRRFTESANHIADLMPQDIGRPLKQFVYKLRYRDLMQDVQKVLETDTNKEMELQAENGRWYLVRIMPYRTLNGGIAGVVLTATDVTQIKQAEQALRESNDRLALAQAAADIGVWDWDLIGDGLIWDKRMCEMYGIDFNTFSGTSEVWRQGLHPEDRADATAEVERILRDRDEYHTEFRIVQPSGEVRHVESHALLICNDDGRPARMVGVNLDITERKRIEVALRESEQRFRQLFNNSMVGVFVATPEGDILYANPAASQMFGYTETELQASGRAELFDTGRSCAAKLMAARCSTRAERAAR